jgi:N-acetylglucosamine kinase-like BadF-type ATPase
VKLVVGVDGGASKTIALVGDATGRVLGMGRAGPSNHQTCGLEAAGREIAQAVRAALAEAGHGTKPASVGVFCLAGADLPEDYAALDQTLAPHGLAARFTIKNDTLAALRSGLSRPWGVAVVCGTGFNAAGRARDGREIVTPGLGYMSGDWGGGGEISQEVIRQAMRAWDGRGPSTRLLPLLLARFGAATPDDLVQALYSGRIGHPEVLDAVLLLFEAAFEGDPVACALVREVGTEVGVTARTLLRRLGLEAEPAEVVLAGSVFKGKGPLLVDTITATVHETSPRAVIARPAFEPVVGAYLLALEAAGVSVDGKVGAEVERSLPPALVNGRGG